VNDPIFRTVIADHPFTSLPPTYTDRFTPEVARQQGVLHGERTTRERILAKGRAIKNPTKQLMAFLAEIEEEND
jgi:hypothetical protein